MKRYLMSGVCLLACWQLAAEPAEDAASDLEFVILGNKEAQRLAIEVRVEGQPLHVLWKENFQRLLSFFDRNVDGVLDGAEAARLPSPLALRQVMQSGFTPAVGQPPDFRALDTNGNLKVDLAELSDFYQRAGLGTAQIGVGRTQTSAELSAALRKHLDLDGDKKVSEKECQAAVETLRKLDTDDNELISVGELAPKATYPGIAATTLLRAPGAAAPALPPLVAQLPLVVLPAARKDVHWTAALVQRLDANKNGRLDAKELAVDLAVFKALDKDRDGELAAKELEGWRDLPSDRRWRLQLGKKGSQPAVAELVSRLQLEESTPGRLRCRAGQTELHLQLDEGRLPAAEAVRKSFLGLFNQLDGNSDGFVDRAEATEPKVTNLARILDVADRDGDGKLSAKELEAWLDLQEHLLRGQVMLSVFDAGAGLFEQMDANNDGLLSIRELRGTWAVLRRADVVHAGNLDGARLPAMLLMTVSRGYPVAPLGQSQRTGPAWFLAMDRNKDGDVSRREFNGGVEVFDRLDLDKDGLLSPEEAAKTSK